MKKLSGLIIAAAFSLQLHAQTASMAIGTTLPEQGYHTTDVLSNKATTLQDQGTSNGLLVIFTCNTCPFVLKNVNRTHEVLDVAKAKGIGVMLVNSNEAQRGDVDSREQMQAFGKAHSYPNYCEDKNSELANIFGASHTPEVFLFDGKTKKLVYKGAMDDNPGDPKSAKIKYLNDAMTNLAAGKAIQPQETKSVGCSIKRVKS